MKIRLSELRKIIREELMSLDAGKAQQNECGCGCGCTPQRKDPSCRCGCPGCQGPGDPQGKKAFGYEILVSGEEDLEES